MRTPKIKALWKIIEWLNNYIIVNQHSKLSKKKILAKIEEFSNLYKNKFRYPVIRKGLDLSPINSNAWLAEFSDANANFSINICKRWNKSSMRVQLFYKL